MKYIIFTIPVGTMTRKLPIIFPDSISHKAMMNTLVASSDAEFVGASPHSAGFVTFGGFTAIKPLGLRAYGKSLSLGLSSLPGDTDILNLHQYGVGLT